MPTTDPVQPAAALAAGLEWVEVRGVDGQVIMQHRFSVGADANEEIVSTVQRAGNDGVWGTADDWRTAEVHCHYQPGEELDARLLVSAQFQPESFLSVGNSSCLWRHPLAGEVNINGTWAQYDDDLLEMVSSFRGTLALFGFGSLVAAGDLIGLAKEGNRLGFGFINVPILQWEKIISASVAGLRFCSGVCQEIPVESLPSGSLCSVNCNGLDNVVYNPYGVLDNRGNPPPAGVQVYNGTQFFPEYEQHRLRRLVQSVALNQPLAFPRQYEEFLYNGDILESAATYTDSGADGRWFTADDVLGSYFSPQVTADGWQRIYYSAAGVDGFWKTGDDDIARTVSLHRDELGRIASVDVCTPPPAVFWMSAEGLHIEGVTCKTITFHYAVNLS